jgi:hypothetical protein
MNFEIYKTKSHTRNFFPVQEFGFVQLPESYSTFVPFHFAIFPFPSDILVFPVLLESEGLKRDPMKRLNQMLES